MQTTYTATLPYWTLRVGEYRAESEVVMQFSRPARLIFGEMWVGYDAYSLLEGGMRVYLERTTQRPYKFTAKPPLYLGGFYLHKHIPFTMTQNDYRELKALNRLQPSAEIENLIRIDRDCKNAGWQPFNCWDCELILVVDE